MAQDSIQITTTPPLPGITLVQEVNKALQTVATDFAGASDPSALAGPYMTWADTGTLTTKRRNAANSGWVIEGRLFRAHMPIIPLAEVPTTDIGPIYIVGKGPAEWAGSAYKVLLPDIPSNDDLQWLGTPIGGTLEMWDHLPGVIPPPTSDPRFRYIRLTASDPYNAGVTSAEVVSGSAPLINAYTGVSLVGSPLYGQTVRLINTEQRFVGAGVSGHLMDDAFQGHTFRALAAGSDAGSSSITRLAVGGAWDGSLIERWPISDGTNGTPRTANATYPRHIRATYYMRIK